MEVENVRENPTTFTWRLLGELWKLKKPGSEMKTAALFSLTAPLSSWIAAAEQVSQHLPQTEGM